MSKFHPGDDGTVVDGKVVVFLNLPRSAEGGEDGAANSKGSGGAQGTAGADAKKHAQPETEASGAKKAEPRAAAIDAGPQAGSPASALKSAAWAKQAAAIGEQVALVAVFKGGPLPKNLAFKVLARDASGGDHKVEQLQPEVAGMRATATWTVDHLEKANPEYFFAVFTGNTPLGNSGRDKDKVLHVKDTIHQLLIDAHTRTPLVQAKYELTLANGEKRAGQTDAEGYIVEEHVPAGKFDIRLSAGVELFHPKHGNVSMEVDDVPVAAGGSAPIVTHADQGQISSLTVKPVRQFAGKKVDVKAAVTGGNGQKVQFRIQRANGKEVAKLEANVAKGVATVSWEVSDASGDGKEFGFPFADFHIEAACGSQKVRAELRGYTRGDK